MVQRFFPSTDESISLVGHRQNDPGPTAFFSFLVNGLPDFVSSGGGTGGAGAASDEANSITRSASRSRTANGASFCVFPSVM